MDFAMRKPGHKITKHVSKLNSAELLIYVKMTNIAGILTFITENVLALLIFCTKLSLNMAISIREQLQYEPQLS